MYSQKDEEAVIQREFAGAPPGRFLDVGAYSGKSLSNTLLLAEQGWSGVLIEPSPVPFAKLLNLHGRNPRMHLLNIAIDRNTGFRTFHDSKGEAVSTLSEKHRARWSETIKEWNTYSLYALNPNALFSFIGCEFSFISVDVEGMNFDICQDFPWNTLITGGLRLVCVEHDGLKGNFVTLFEKYGLELFYENPENMMFRLKP